MTAFEFLRNMHNEWCHFQTRESKKVGRASNSELRRWCNNGAVWYNGEAVTSWDEEMCFPVLSYVLFPNHPVTLR